MPSEAKRRKLDSCPPSSLELTELSSEHIGSMDEGTRLPDYATSCPATIVERETLPSTCVRDLVSPLGFGRPDASIYESASPLDKLLAECRAKSMKPVSTSPTSEHSSATPLPCDQPMPMPHVHPVERSSSNIPCISLEDNGPTFDGSSSKLTISRWSR